MGAGIAEIISGAIEGTFNTGINIWNAARQQAKFDYDRALQEQIFQREDTAVQRRMADLQAAGLNPQLAAGSGAGSGAVVSTSAPQMANSNMLGTVLDTVKAVEQIRQQKEQTQILNAEKRLQHLKLVEQGINNTILKNNYNYLFGDLNNVVYHDLYGNILNNSRFVKEQDLNFQNLIYSLDSNKNSAELLQKQNNWFTANQILNAVGSVVGDISKIAGVGYLAPRFISNLQGLKGGNPIGFRAY